MKTQIKEHSRFKSLLLKRFESTVSDDQQITSNKAGLTKSDMLNHIILNKELEHKVFLYSIKESRLIASILEKISHISPETQHEINKPKIINTELKQTRSIGKFAISAIIGLLVGAVSYKHLMPLLKDSSGIFQTPKDLLKAATDTDLVKELGAFKFLGPTYLDRLLNNESLEESPETTDNINDALIKLKLAHAGVVAITENITFKLNSIRDTVVNFFSFVKTYTPFGLINILFGKFTSNIIDKLQQRIQDFYTDFWQSASTYVRDLFKWIQLKNVMDPVTGIASGFVSFISKTYNAFTRQFGGSTNIDEEQRATQSTVLNATTSIFAAMISTVKIRPKNQPQEVIEYEDTDNDFGITETKETVKTIDSTKQAEQHHSDASGTQQKPLELATATGIGSANDTKVRGYVNYVMKHRHHKSLGLCSRYVRRAIQSQIKFEHAYSAYQNHTDNRLRNAGFILVSTGKYYGGGFPAALKTGDIIVWDRHPPKRKHSHSHGHISITINDSGTQCSDFLQKTFVSCSCYTNGATYWVYRWPGANNTGTKSSSSGAVVSTSPANQVSLKPKPVNQKTGIGGPSPSLSDKYDDASFRINPFSVASSVQNEDFKFYSGGTTLPDENEFIGEIYSAMPTNTDIVRIKENNKSVLLKTNGKSAQYYQHPDKSKKEIVQLKNQPKTNQQTKTLPTQSKQIEEIFGKHPLDILLSADINGNMSIVL